MKIPLSFLKKVDADYAAYLELWQDRPFSEVLPKIPEIHHMVKLHKCLHTSGINPHAEWIAYLNRFAHPLTILLAHWEQYCKGMIPRRFWQICWRTFSAMITQTNTAMPSTKPSPQKRANNKK